MKLLVRWISSDYSFVLAASNFPVQRTASANPFASPVRASNEDKEPARVISEHIDAAYGAT